MAVVKHLVPSKMTSANAGSLPQGFPATNEWKRLQPPKKTKKIPDIGVENILQEIKNDPAPPKMTILVYKETYF